MSCAVSNFKYVVYLNWKLSGSQQARKGVLWGHNKDRGQQVIGEKSLGWWESVAHMLNQEGRTLWGIWEMDKRADPR